MFSFATVANIHFRSKKVLAKLLLLLFTFFRLLPGLDYPQCLVAGINTLPSRCSEELFIKKSLQRLYCSKRLFRQKALSSKSSVLVHGWWRSLLSFCWKGIVLIVTKQPKIRVFLKLSCWTPRKGRGTLQSYANTSCCCFVFFTAYFLL